MVSRETMKKSSARPPADLADHLGYWLRFVSNHVSQAFTAKLATLDVMVVEWVVLRELFSRGDMSPSDLATRLGMTRGGVSKLVDRLEARGLLMRDTGTGDRRYQTLTLTADGKALVPRLATLADQNETEFFGHLTATKRDTLRSMLTDLVAHHGLRTVPTE